MVAQIKVTGMILSVMPIGEYDKRVVILTTDYGKISAFSRGSRRSNSSMLAATSPFVFGEFVLNEGRNTYTLVGAQVQNYFMELREDINAAYYGFYFLEFSDYYTRENLNGTIPLKLLYQTMRALTRDSIPNQLVRRIFELKMLVVNGEYPQCYQCISCGREDDLSFFSSLRNGCVCSECRPGIQDAAVIDGSTLYAVQYIISTSVEKLYSFTVTDLVQHQLDKIMDKYLSLYIDKSFKSLDILKVMVNDLSLS